MSDSNPIKHTPRMSSWRFRLHEIIFEADTAEGKAFDIALLICIVLSVLVALFESVPSFRTTYGPLLRLIEWVFTLLFTAEYILRLICVVRPLRYALSFFGVVDLLAIVPTYLSLFVTGTHLLIVIRALRLLRVFRVLKLAYFVGEAKILRYSLQASFGKIVVFLGTVLTLVVIIGAVMYLIEGEKNGFTSIPQSIYWAIVTMTTVGYGDIAPNTLAGKVLASIVMIVGYSIIAVPTGIVSVHLSRRKTSSPVSTQACPVCSEAGHDVDARHCKYCGGKL